MKSQKVIALLLSTALSISTCMPLGNITALGAETGATVQTVEVQEEASDSAENTESPQEESQEKDSSEAEAYEEAAEEANDSASETLPEDGREESAEEAETEDDEDDADSDESNAAVPAQEAESSEADTAAAEEEADPAASEDAAPAADTADKNKAEGSTTVPGETNPVRDDAMNYTELSPQDDFSGAVEINPGDVMDVSITEENGYVLYRFVPEETAEYRFYSYDASGDPKAGLYNASKQLIESYDDNSAGNNFRIARLFSEGETYYFQAGMYSGTGSYKVCLQKPDFQCFAVGEPERIVSPNEDVTLEVNATSSAPISYQWYDENDNAIEGATSSSYTFKPEKNRTYYCQISDEGGNSATIYYTVQVENHLNAYPEGGEEYSDYKYFYVEPGASLDLGVSVSADDISGLTYEWRNESGLIEGADSTTYTIDSVTKEASYSCRVSDQYGNTAYAYFYVYVQNNLNAYTESEEGYSTTENSIYVTYNETADLNVTVSADDMSQLTYQWYGPDSNPIEGCNSTTCTTDPVTKSATYRFQVNDQYGNYANVYFYAYVQNHLNAYTEDEYGNASTSTTIHVSANTSVDLNVNVSADDMSQLTYKWYNNGTEVQDASSTTYSTNPVTKNDNYYFEVCDQYGNRKTVSFNIVVQNNLDAYTIDENGSETRYCSLSIPYNECAELDVTVSADDMSQLTYQWHGYDQDPKVGNIPTTCTTDPVTKNTTYYFEVYDQYGNYVDVYFYLYVKNNLQAYTEYPDGVTTSSITLYVSLNEPVDLSATVSADDMSQLTYKWYKNDRLIKGADSTTYTVDSVTEYTRYHLQVFDQYGNYAYVYFYVYVENNLRAYTEDQYGGSTFEAYLEVAPNTSANLSVTVSADDMSQLTCKWYKGNRLIKGADSTTITTDPAVEEMYYHFEVCDQYGNYAYVDFSIHAENHLKAYPAGEDEEYTSKDFEVAPGDPVTMEVIVSADDMSQLTYEWRDADNNPVDGAGTTSCTIDPVTKSQNYYFNVTDQYGNSRGVSFYIYVENHLTVSTKSGSNIDAAPGSSVTLEALVSADDMSQLTYEWYKWNDDYDRPQYVLIEGADLTSYTIDSVTESGEYQFHVKDQYGNERTVYFYVYATNRLTARAISGHMSVAPGASVTLEAAVSANDMSQLTYEWFDSNDDLIEGADSTTYIIDSLTKSGTYQFRVSDQYGNTDSVYFNIYVENHLTAEAEDVGDGSKTYSVLHVTPGEKVNLNVLVSADDMSQLTYEWRDSDDNLIEGADSASYIIDSLTKNEEYHFRVSDQYDNQAYVDFVLYAENHLTAYPEGSDSDDSSKRVSVIPGSPAELKVVVSADDMSQLTYEWYKFEYGDLYDYVLIEDANSTSYTVNSVTSYEEYRFKVSDQYGNYKTVYFDVDPGNGLTAYAEGTENESSTNISVVPGTSVNLKVIASAIDTTGIAYSWYVDDDIIDGEVSDSYTVNSVTTKHTYECKVTDRYSNSRYVDFYVSANHLIVYPEGADEDTTRKYVYVASGSPAELKLFVSADDMSQLTYIWYDTTDDSVVIAGADSSSYTTESINQRRSYRCDVTDQYGNKKRAYFTVDLLDYSNPRTIKAGDSHQVSVSEESPYVMFKFVPTVTAEYTVYSSNDTVDPYIEVFNDSYERLFYDDDDGEGSNFKLTEPFTAGTTYYIRARAYSTSSDGSYTIHLEKEQGLSQVITAEDKMSLAYGNSGTISVSGAQGTLSFTSSNPSVASVDSTGKVTANKIGTAKITIFAEETDTYNQSNTITVTVTVTGISIKDAVVSGIENRTYNGSAQTQTPVVKLGSTTLSEGSDYTISYSNNTNAGTATVTITGNGAYTGTKTSDFTISPASIVDAEVSGIEDTTYNGEEQKPAPVIKVGSATLTEDTDYTVAYSSNTNAGKATVTITGKGNYADTKNVDFTIKPVSIEDAEVTGIVDKTYDGSAQTQDLVVKVGSTTLAENTDYTVAYSSNINAGKATVTITGKGNYTGSASPAEFTINPASIEGAEVTGIVDKTYDGSEQTQTPVVKVGSATLVNETDYTVTCSNNTNAGTASVTITGMGNYTGTKPFDFTINPASIEDAEVTGIVDKTYDGSEQTQSPVVKVGSATLEEKTDYTLTYSNNVEEGTATVTITGIGNYTGTKEVHFTISDKLSIETAEVDEITGLVYNGEEQKPTPVVKIGSTTLKEGTDYTIDSYSNNTNAGTAAVTITGKGSYINSKTIEFTISPAPISSTDISGIVKKTYNGKEQTQTPVVKFGSATLTEGTDYTVSYSNNKNAGKDTAIVTFTAVENTNFTGTVDKTFTIDKAAQNFTVKAAASSIDVGKTTKVTASGAKENPKYTFTSSNAKIATVNTAGTVTGKAAGTVTITVKAAATANYKELSKTVTITVNKVLKKPGNCHFIKWNNTKYTSCRIGWKKTEGADGYQTLLSWTDGSHASSTIVKANVLYRDCTVHPQHVSQMKVRAFYMQNGQRKYGPWSNVEYITPSPAKLTTRNTSSGSNLKMNVSWNIIYGCNGYNVFITTNPNGKWYWYQSTSQKATATSAVINKCGGSNLKKNTRYYVRIVTRRKRNGVFCTVPMPANNTYVGSFIIK